MDSLITKNVRPAVAILPLRPRRKCSSLNLKFRNGHCWNGRESTGSSGSIDLPNFAEALSFTNRVGALAEEEGHHPAILTEWGRVTVTLWTHKIRGLHRNDFIMAAKVDSLAP